MSLVAAGSGFFSQIHSGKVGVVHDFLITEADASTSIAISADSAFLKAMECVVVRRDHEGTRQEIDLWPLMLAHFAGQIRTLGEVVFSSMVADDICELLRADSETKDTSSLVASLAVRLFADALTHEASLGPPDASEQIPSIHWMQFSLTPLLLSPISLGSVLPSDRLPETGFNPVLLRFRHKRNHESLPSGVSETNGLASVLVSEGQFRRVKVIKDLKQIRRQLGPMGVLQRSLLVPILETVCEMAEHASEQHGAS
jgi:hypothetical protein